MFKTFFRLVIEKRAARDVAKYKNDTTIYSHKE